LAPRTAPAGQRQSFSLAFQTNVALHSQALPVLATNPVPFVVMSAQLKQMLDELTKVLASVQTQANLSGLNVNVYLHSQSPSSVLFPVPYLLRSWAQALHLLFSKIKLARH
jgi:hypothetical protein